MSEAYCDQCAEFAIVVRKDGTLFCLNRCDVSKARECGCGGYYVGPNDRCSVCQEYENQKDL